jgi:predicted transcriptional regulator
MNNNLSLNSKLANRSKQELYASILKSAASNIEGTRITRLMYDSFLSYTMISRDLRQLVKAGLLVNEPEITRYKITDKGLRYLALFEKMNELINY